MVDLLGGVDPFCLRSEVEDCLRWAPAANGLFLVKSFREIRWAEIEKEEIWSIIWKMPIPFKVIFFLWTIVKGRLPTMDLL